MKTLMISVLLVIFSTLILCNENEKDLTLDVFKDNNLKKCVSTKLKDSSSRKEDLLKIESLDCAGYNIRSLDGIERLENLKLLDLSSNQILDLRNIGKLKKLISLNLCNNYGDEYIEKIEADSMAKLKKAVVARTSMDLSGLIGHTSLKNLALCGSYIKDVKAISNIQTLERLFLHANQINDITPLNNLTNLKRLSLGQNKNIDIKGNILKKLDKLWYEKNNYVCDRSFSVRKELGIEDMNIFLPFYKQVCVTSNGIEVLPSFEKHLLIFNEMILSEKIKEEVYRIFIWKEEDVVNKYVKLIVEKDNNFKLRFKSTLNNGELNPSPNNKEIERNIDKKDINKVDLVLKSLEQVFFQYPNINNSAIKNDSNLVIVVEIFRNGKYQSHFSRFDKLNNEAANVIKKMIELPIDE